MGEMLRKKKDGKGGYELEGRVLAMFDKMAKEGSPEKVTLG